MGVTFSDISVTYIPSKVRVHGKSRGSQDRSFKCLLRAPFVFSENLKYYSLQKKRGIYSILQKKLDLVICGLEDLESLHLGEVSFHVQSSGA